MNLTSVDRSAKIQPEHVERSASVYVRQSSLRQVEQHREGRLRQYQLVDWAQELGWPKERIRVIDEDQGKTGSLLCLPRIWSGPRSLRNLGVWVNLIAA